jgi:hypothetical protein
VAKPAAMPAMVVSGAKPGLRLVTYTVKCPANRCRAQRDAALDTGRGRVLSHPAQRHHQRRPLSQPQIRQPSRQPALGHRRHASTLRATIIPPP